MASCKWEKGKCHGATEAKAKMRHDEIEEAFRAVAKKKNKHIDLEKCKYNFTRYGRNYEECCRLYDQRIAELDAMPKQNHKKDRVTMCSVEVPAPKDLPPDQIKAWFTRVGDLFEKRYGKQNMIEMFVHADEVHEYDHCETGERVESRIHAHVCFVPVKDDKLNAKALSLQKNMKALNRAVDKISTDEFGVKFMDGSKKKSFKTVEQLKEESAYKQIEREKKEAERIIAEAKKQQQADAERQQRLDAQAARLMGWRNDLQEQESELESQRTILSVDRQKLDAARTRLEADRAILDRDRKNYRVKVENSLKTQYNALGRQLKKEYQGKVDKVEQKYMELLEYEQSNADAIKYGKAYLDQLERQKAGRTIDHVKRQALLNNLDSWNKFSKTVSDNGLQFP